ncbi:MAG TPA: DUF389 domain-containing protein [Niabella sp.]|nr:DUF389 domain-containing protein [Niabella sp.]
MLISPLMGPIVGAGFALGTYDFSLLKKSMKNLFIATVVSLLVSSVYFYLSPFKDVQSELLARTAPNIYDVLIAFFGGLVGVIAITRVKKGNPIPGVAIATALMPPLCTAGYGLATFNLTYFAGAFYLYTINCFFICIATFLIVKYLRYPAASFKGKRYTRQIRLGITSLIFIMIIPSCYLAYRLWNEKAYTKTVENFINTEFVNNGYMVIYKKINYNGNPRKVELALLNKNFNDQEIKNYNRILNDMGAGNTLLTFRQNDEDLKSEILKEINKQENTISEKDIAINKLSNELSKYKLNDPTLTKELNILFPLIKSISLGKIEQYPTTDSTRMQCVLLYNAPQDIEEEKLKSWLSERLNTENIVLIKQ